MRRIMLATALILCASGAHAANWKIDPAQSKLGFTAIENGAQITGSFKQFTGNIAFDKDHPEAAKISVDVPLASVETPDPQVASTLAVAEWFDSAKFPSAHFESTKVTKKDAEHYTAEGMLTLKGVTQPLALTFHFTQYDAKRAVAVGEAKLIRQQFHIGSGEWEKSDTIGKEVGILFTLAADAQ